MTQQIQTTKRAIDALFADRDALVSSIVADGWSREMATAGVDLHEQTWDVERAAASIEQELVTLGSPVASVAHVWPALPGAGVSPWIYAALAGVKTQYIRPSSRGRRFAEFFTSAVSPFVPTELIMGDVWRTVANHIVASGSDETIAAIRDAADAPVTGYGHRVSIAVVDSDFVRPETITNLALDIVLWRQQGCFSVRAIAFIGDDIFAFAESLADAIARTEVTLAVSFTDDDWAIRAQKRASSEFLRPVFGSGMGWTEIQADPIDGQTIGVNAVSVHQASNPDAVMDLIAIPKKQRQGVALVGDREVWAPILLNSGFTRVADAGRMQAPEIEWPHDGRSNISDFFR